MFKLPICRTDHFKSTFIPTMSVKKYSRNVLGLGFWLHIFHHLQNFYS